MSKVGNNMHKTDKLEINRLYAMTGGLAVVGGAILAAFTAKSPTTLALWSSAYLVLVVGVAQVIFAIMVAQATRRALRRLVVWFYILYNTGSLVVIASSVMKYGGCQQHVGVTIGGAALIIGAMCLMLLILRTIRASWLKLGAYCLVGLLLVTSVIGLMLAGID